MLIELVPGIETLIVNNGSEKMILKKGDKVQLDSLTSVKYMKDGLIQNAEYLGFMNSELVTVKYVDEIGWRPIG